VSRGTGTTTTLIGIGHLSDVGLSIIERVHGVQTTVMLVTVFTLVLVALFAERRQSEETLSGGGHKECTSDSKWWWPASR
jgi:hypothetical protein